MKSFLSALSVRSAAWKKTGLSMIALGMLGIAFPAFSQTQNNPIPGIDVVVRKQPGGSATTVAKSDARGNFSGRVTEPGTYSMNGLLATQISVKFLNVNGNPVKANPDGSYTFVVKQGASVVLSGQVSGTVTATVATKVAVQAKNMAELQATTDKATASIQASTADKQALVEVVRAKNTEKAKAILLRNGFTAKQLDGLKITLTDATGGKNPQEWPKVKITPDLDPPGIHITITF